MIPSVKIRSYTGNGTLNMDQSIKIGPNPMFNAHFHVTNTYIQDLVTNHCVEFWYFELLTYALVFLIFILTPTWIFLRSKMAKNEWKWPIEIVLTWTNYKNILFWAHISHSIVVYQMCNIFLLWFSRKISKWHWSSNSLKSYWIWHVLSNSKFKPRKRFALVRISLLRFVMI